MRKPDRMNVKEARVVSSAKLTFLGAVGEVTGSAYLLEVGDSKVLVDCGMYQGLDSDRKNAEPAAVDLSGLDAVLLTHAHIDHSGRLPLLVKQGFKGKILATDPTIELSKVLLRDTAHLMAEEAEWRSRKNVRQGLPPVRPMYDEGDVENTLELFHYIGYDDLVSVAPGISARFRDSGHIVGAAMIEVWVGEPNPIKIVFSGDIGPRRTVIEKSPTIIEEADFVVIESTYGDRAHKGLEETREEFRQALATAISDRGKILIPTFVVDRAQRVLYELLLLQSSPDFPALPKIYFDSPMGEKATRIYDKYLGLFSQEMQDFARAGESPFAPRGLVFTAGIEESRAINKERHAIVMAGSGMCSGGRIVHHLKHNLWSDKCNVFFVGYQARGTLGRRLIDGEKRLRIAGEDIEVKAKLHTLGGFSAHGDRDDLLKWASYFGKNTMFFVTHGEPKSSQALASGLSDLGYRSIAPSACMTYDLSRKDPVSAVELPRGAPSKSFARDEALALLQDISSETESLREKLSSIEDYAAIVPLLESSRLILKTAKNVM
mgnify:CR=1 FL=1